jgi:hypothetical protein
MGSSTSILLDTCGKISFPHIRRGFCFEYLLILSALRRSRIPEMSLYPIHKTGQKEQHLCWQGASGCIM